MKKAIQFSFYGLKDMALGSSLGEEMGTGSQGMSNPPKASTADSTLSALLTISKLTQGPSHSEHVPEVTVQDRLRAQRGRLTKV